MAVLFGDVARALLGRVQQTIADVVEHEVCVEGPPDADAIDADRGIGLHACVLDSVQVLSQDRVLLARLESLPDLLLQQLRLDIHPRSGQARGRALLDLGYLIALLVDTPEIPPPLSPMFLEHDLLPDLLIQDHAPVGRVPVQVADRAVLALLVAVVLAAPGAVQHVVD